MYIGYDKDRIGLDTIRYDQDGSLFSLSEFFLMKFVNFISLKEFFEVSKWCLAAQNWGFGFSLHFFLSY